MKEINDWYWTHGVQRGNDPGDPDRALRKISVGDWFDPVASSADRIETLRHSLDAKSTIALWGPSQTGKSTLLSRYLDGDMPDGSDSALTWNPETPVRFSPLFLCKRPCKRPYTPTPTKIKVTIGITLTLPFK